MKHSILFLTVLLALGIQSGLSQGCVAIRHFSCGNTSSGAGILHSGDWQIGMNYRYFKSFRHFRGLEEEPDRLSNSSEVINHATALDLSVAYGITPRLSANVILPFVINTRSSLYEHGRSERNTTFSRGLADARIGLTSWLLDPETSTKGNVAIGLGLKVPTGDYQATDIFYNVGVEGAPEVRPVDQSIQPGDGGFGATIDLAFFRSFTENLSVYGNGFYLVNPRETNGVRTFRETLSPLLQNESIMAVPDQYSVRAGVNLGLGGGIVFGLGGRYEGVPVHDLVGGDAGFRRPGNVLSVEPGLMMTNGPWMLNLNVPVALRRNRPQSVTDREIDIERNGDAAFADYLVNFSMTYRISGKPQVPPVLFQ